MLIQLSRALGLRVHSKDSRAKLVGAIAVALGTDQLRWPDEVMRLLGTVSQDLVERMRMHLLTESARYRGTDWLESSDIEAVLARLEDDTVRRFKFLGFGTPRGRRVADTQVHAAIRDRKTRLARVYHVGSNHWTVAMYILGARPRFEYMDSFGDPPPRWVLRDMNAIAQAIRVSRRFPDEPWFNTTRVQRGTHECGMYVLSAIHRGLTRSLRSWMKDTGNACWTNRKRYFRSPI